MKKRTPKRRAKPARRVQAEYRYTLSRDLRDLLSQAGKLVLWCALNPSTANESEDDPSSRRMMEFTRVHGGNRMLLVNAYAAKATKPNRLRLFEDPIGPDNDRRIVRSARVADLIIACWGNPPFKDAATRFEHVTDLLREHGDVYRLGDLTNQGQPRHPLYLPYDQTRVPLTLHVPKRPDEVQVAP